MHATERARRMFALAAPFRVPAVRRPLWETPWLHCHSEIAAHAYLRNKCTCLNLGPYVVCNSGKVRPYDPLICQSIPCNALCTCTLLLRILSAHVGPHILQTAEMLPWRSSVLKIYMQQGMGGLPVGFAHDAVHQMVVKQAEAGDRRLHVQVYGVFPRHPPQVLAVAHPCQRVHNLIVAGHLDVEPVQGTAQQVEKASMILNC